VDGAVGFGKEEELKLKQIFQMINENDQR